MAFVADFASAWQRWREVHLGDGEDLSEERRTAAIGAWQAERATLRRTHFVSLDGPDLYLVDLDRSNHSPAWEQILTTELDLAHASIRTVQTDGPEPIHYEYQLSQSVGGWRITSVRELEVTPAATVLDAAETAALVAGVSLTAPLSDPLAALPDLVTSIPDFAALFATPNAVRALGQLTTGGLLTVHDFGQLSWAVVPLAREIPAGTYPVELSQDRDGTNLALRLKLSATAPVEWRSADQVGHAAYVSVEANTVALLDFNALARCDADRAADLPEQIQLADTEPGRVFSLVEDQPTDAVMVTSGLGDGAYPIYWGVAADGSLTELVVDFLVEAA